MKINQNEKGSAFVILLVGLALVYGLLFFWGSRGWGYMGYRGYHSGPSWLYFGGPRYYYGGSVRGGSVGGGRSHRGGGFRGGK